MLYLIILIALLLVVLLFARWKAMKSLATLMGILLVAAVVLGIYNYVTTRPSQGSPVPRADAVGAEARDTVTAATEVAR